MPSCSSELVAGHRGEAGASTCVSAEAGAEARYQAEAPVLGRAFQVKAPVLRRSE